MKNFLLTTLFTILFISFGFCQTEPTLSPENWQRHDRHDGYVIGNGQMYVIAGLGKELNRKGKSQLSNRSADLNRIAWVIGPTYSVGNLGYGWEPIPILNKDTLSWESQKIIQPDGQYNFWGASSHHPALELSTQDILLDSESLFIREMEVTKPATSSTSDVQFYIPVYADPRNSYYAMFSGAEVDASQITRWGEACGPNLKTRSSIPKNELKIAHPKTESIILKGANHALWQEISTIVPKEKIYKKLFPYRAAASSVSVENGSGQISVDTSGFTIHLGQMAPGESRKLYLFIAAESGKKRNVQKKAVAKLADWKQRDPESVIKMAIQNKADFLFNSQSENQSLVQSINSCLNLISACKPELAGAMAQPYMYPMYYVRDQYGPFRLFLAAGEYKKAHSILQFYVAKQNQDGIQNAHDLFPEAPDPSIWLPDANSKNGHHSIAEVPSYIILMARDYYQATGNLEQIKPLYKRLKYNLEVQAPSINGVLPFAGDESYTNTRETIPKYREEMTDSHLLFLAAAKFMKNLATKLGKEEDAKAFSKTYEEASEVLFERMWLPAENYFVYARDKSDDKDKMDKRPAFDALLRWFYLEMGDLNGTIPQQNLNAVMDQLTNPIRVVPEFAWCAGMDAGYLLYALSRSQHPLAHKASQLLLNYASDQGLYSEYYRYQGDTIVPTGGTLRPWESAVNGLSLVQYLSGLRIDMPNKKIFLQPHLPEGWTQWESREMPLYQEGILKIKLTRVDKKVTCQVSRKGGKQTMQLDIEFGLFGKNLSATDSKLQAKNGMPNLLFAQEELPPSLDGTITEFTFRIDKP